MSEETQESSDRTFEIFNPGQPAPTNLWVGTYVGKAKPEPKALSISSPPAAPASDTIDLTIDCAEDCNNDSSESSGTDVADNIAEITGIPTTEDDEAYVDLTISNADESLLQSQRFLAKLDGKDAPLVVTIPELSEGATCESIISAADEASASSDRLVEQFEASTPLRSRRKLQFAVADAADKRRLLVISHCTSF